MVVRNILRNLSRAAKKPTSMCAEQNEGERKKSKILHSVQCVEWEGIARCIADLLQLSHFGTLVCVFPGKTRGRNQDEGLAEFPEALPAADTGLPWRAAAWSKKAPQPL